MSMTAALVRRRVGLVALLVALAAVAWWWTAHEMRGMDDGPWTGLGGLGWFVSVWVVMMAAMMLPSVSPTVALYARLTERRSPVPGLVFVAGYLTTWAGAGAAAYGFAAAGGHVAHGVLMWDRAGRWVATGTLATCACAGAAARSARCSVRGVGACAARSRWARGTARGASGAAGR